MVNLPPFFLGVTLLFWGWETGLWVMAVVGALGLELPRWVDWRWEFSELEMNRILDFCVLLFMFMAIYGYVTTDLAHGPARFMPWLPAIFFPFAAANAYCAQDRVRLSTYFTLLRRPGRVKTPLPLLGGFVGHVYFVLCFIGASVANQHDLRFYAGVALLGVWLLWQVRYRLTPLWVWIGLTLIVVFGGYQGQIGLHQLQLLIENSTTRLFEDLSGSEMERTQAWTAIGSVGKLKQSSRIVLRLETDGRQEPPGLLRKNSFSGYRDSGRHASWLATGSLFSSVPAGADGTTWTLAPDRGSLPEVTISIFLSQGMGIIPAPQGPTTMNDFLVAELQTNSCGSIRAIGTPPLARYRVRYGDGSTLDAAPTPRDLEVPERERPALRQIATELGLAGLPPQQALQRVQTFFREKFTYRLELKGTENDSAGSNTALSQFLLRDRAGHCEYFATASALLLRQAGLPTRYATGFLVSDEEKRGKVYWVRSRHAHAWTLVYVAGQWRSFDATPADSGNGGQEAPSRFQSISDWFTELRYRFNDWWYYSDRQALATYLPGLVACLLLWLAWRVVGRKRRIRLKNPPAASRSMLNRPGLDSEFYRVEQQLARIGLGRRADESLKMWVSRVVSTCPSDRTLQVLDRIVTLHSAYRFDPQGLSAEQRGELRACVETWLAQQQALEKIANGKG